LILSFLYNIASGNLNITKLTFDAIPTSSQTVTVLYRVSGHYPAYPYTVYSTAITVGSDGYLISPVSIPVTLGTTYDIQVLQNCSSPASGVEQTITITIPVVQNNVLYGSSIPTVCGSGIAITLYTNGSLTINSLLYTDNKLTTQWGVTTTIANNGTLYNVVNGLVQSLYGVCNSVTVTADQYFGTGSLITSITGLTGFALTGSLTVNQTQQGTHTAVSNINIVLNASGLGSSNTATLIINNVELISGQILVNGANNLSAAGSILPTDVISILLSTNE